MDEAEKIAAQNRELNEQLVAAYKILALSFQSLIDVLCERDAALKQAYQQKFGEAIAQASLQGNDLNLRAMIVANFQKPS